jgi:phosphoglycerate dehydrogenase-like enzyme
MTNDKLTIFINQKFPDPAANDLLARELSAHRVIYSQSITTSNLSASQADPAINEADVAFGQPDPAAIITAQKLKWAHLTSAGYERYDRADLRTALSTRGGILTNSSSVYEEPCAEHVVAMMYALARQLPASIVNQQGPKAWPANLLRRQSRLLTGQTALLLSFGAIARRVVELLAPFRMNLIALRRNPTGKEPIKTIAQSQLDSILPTSDHVLNILPGSQSTKGFFSAQRLAQMKKGAIFYNIGRGQTVDQDALIQSLRSGHLAAAYLDVTDPEPLPPDHPLWTTPNCHITPHTAGGHEDEFVRLVRHFLDNLRRFDDGVELRDRVI